MTPNGTNPLKHDALAQLDATLAAMHRLGEEVTKLAHGLEQSKEALAHAGDSLWVAAPDATAALTWQIAQMNAHRALTVADELDPAAAGKPMPQTVPASDAPVAVDGEVKE